MYDYGKIVNDFEDRQPLLFPRCYDILNKTSVTSSMNSLTRWRNYTVKLKIVLTPSEEEGYTVYVPSLPGCISEGNTR